MTVRLLQPVNAAHRTEVPYDPQNLSDAVSASINAIARIDTIYQKDGALVLAQRGVNGLQLRELSRPLLRMMLTECLVFTATKVRKNKIAVEPILPPDAVVDAVLQCPDRWREAGIREVSGVSRLPGCTPDGQLLEEGYNAKYRRLVDFDGKVYPMPGTTKEEAEAAFNRVADLLCDFPFTTEPDRLVAVSLFITAVHRSLMRVCPAYLADSPSPEIGKSLVVDLASALITGRRAQTINPTRDQNEMRKSIFSMLSNGCQHIAIDNIDITFGGAAFDILVTQETYPDRVLGISEMRAPSTVALVTLTGRNVAFAGDGALRTIRTQMATSEERPGANKKVRKYPRIFDYVIENRERIVSDCITITRAYLLAERPNTTSLREFDDWCMRVREPLIWLGKMDIAESIENVRKDSDETGSAMREFLHAWYAIYEDDTVVFQDVIKSVRSPPTGPDRDKYERMADAIEVLGIDPHKTKCSHTLTYTVRPNLGRPFGGMVMRRAIRKNAGHAYRVTSEKQQETNFKTVDPVDQVDYFGLKK